MKAAVLKQFGAGLAIEFVPDPVAGTGEIIVDVKAAPVLSYTDEVLSGARRYLLPVPVIPGCGAIGRVLTTGPDATQLAPGDWVFCDPTVRSRDDATTPDITLQGWSARGEGGQKLQAYFLDGPFAEQMRVPTENAMAIGSIDAPDAARWSALNILLIPYGGLLAANLQAGETVLISGATGRFGGAAVAVALAMGAACVVAPGRDEAKLADLRRRFGTRVVPVKLSGEGPADTERMIAAAPSVIDCVLDFLPPAVDASVVRAAVMTVRAFGRVILMGGVGMLGGDDLALPYPWIMRNDVTVRGKWMYPRDAVPRMIGLIRSGLLRLDEYAISTFGLDEANAAVSHAAADASPFGMTVITP